MSLAEPAPVLPRVARGEDDAFKECVRRYKNFVYAIARRWLGDGGDVEDACQEIFVALWRSAASFDATRGSEATFVALVARRRLIDRQRTPATRPLPTALPVTEPSGSALESYVDARVAAHALADCNEEQRRVILLSVLHGLTYDEIAKELAIPLSTAKSHYYRGIERIKRALRQSEERT